MRFWLNLGIMLFQVDMDRFVEAVQISMRLFKDAEFAALVGLAAMFVACVRVVCCCFCATVTPAIVPIFIRRFLLVDMMFETDRNIKPTHLQHTNRQTAGRSAR